MKYDVIIIGCGASGACSGIVLKQNGINVAIIEQNDRIMKKILKTGNGKCNIFNRDLKSEYYNDFSLVNKNVDLDSFFNNLGLLLKTDNNHRVYPYSESSNNVVSILSKEILDRIPVFTNCEVVEIKKEAGIFIVKSSDERAFQAKKVILATGSKAQEKTNGYTLAKNFGHHISKLRPGLVSLITKEKTIHLKGIRIKCSCKIKENLLKGELLFKDNGLSGILAFDISRLIDDNDDIYFDLAPDFTENELKKHFQNCINNETALNGLFPKMVGLDLIKRCGNEQDKIIQEIKRYHFTVISRGDFDNAQITLGGVDIRDINLDYSSKLVDGLYIIGEVLDVDGACGGYNLYFAISSGIICAQSIIEKLTLL